MNRKYTFKDLLLPILCCIVFIAIVIFCAISCSQKIYECQINSLDTNKVSLSYSFNISDESTECKDDTLQICDTVDLDFPDSSNLVSVPIMNFCFYNEGGYCLVIENDNLILYCKNTDLVESLRQCNIENVNLSINKKQAYAKVKDFNKLQYSSNVEDYDSAETFANFRPMNAGNIKQNLLWRGASPSNNLKGRAYVVDDFLQQNQIKNILCLSENKQDLDQNISNYNISNEYYLNLISGNQNICYKLGGTESEGKTNQQIAVEVVNLLSEAQTSTYIHCFEGKDRTGLVCEIIEMLTGASYDEIVDDYMLSYKNYYNITKAADPELYQAIKKNFLDDNLAALLGITSNVSGDKTNMYNLDTIDIQQKMTEVYFVNCGSVDKLDKFMYNFCK